MIRKDISKSEKFASLSKESMILFNLLIPHYNSWGKMNGSPYFIKGEVCPLIDFLDVKTIEKCLKEITLKTNVKWFEFQKIQYIQSLGFEEHQNFRKDRRGADNLPNYEECRELQENSWSTTGELQGNSARKEKEKEKEKGKGKAEPASVTPFLSPLALLWNEVCTNLPKVQATSRQRRIKENCRLGEHPLDWWKEVFERINLSSFCRGNNERSWTATYDWIISNDTNALKVMEGKYDNRKSSKDLDTRFARIQELHQGPGAEFQGNSQ
jgi:hypothetical protein